MIFHYQKHTVLNYLYIVINVILTLPVTFAYLRQHIQLSSEGPRED
jgi:hypothetical protein